MKISGDYQQFERKIFTIGIPFLLGGLILLANFITQEYQMGKSNSFLSGLIFYVVALGMIVGYFLVPHRIRKRFSMDLGIYWEGMVIYIVAIAEAIYFIIAYSIGGLQAPEFMFLHLFYLVPFLFFTIIYFARMYSPKRRVSLVMHKRIILALFILTFLSQWIAIPQILSAQIQVRFDTQLKTHLGEDYEEQIPQDYRTTFQDGIFHVGAYMSPVSFECEVLTDLLVYDYGDFQLRLHWYYPKDLAPNETRPGLLSVHGGGFISGHAGDLDQTTLCEWWVSRGYVIGTLEYRLSPDYRFPAAIEDVRRALVYMKNNAIMLHLDVNNTGLIGRSAGSTLIINSLSNNTWLYENTGRISSSTMVPISCVIAMYPVVDFVELMSEFSAYNLIYRIGPYNQYFGVTYEENPEMYAIASPLDSIRPDFPPMLVIGAGLDSLTPKGTHIDKLTAKSTEMNMDLISMQVPWANHAFDELLTSRSGVLCCFAWERFAGYHLARNRI